MATISKNRSTNSPTFLLIFLLNSSIGSRLKLSYCFWNKILTHHRLRCQNLSENDLVLGGFCAIMKLRSWRHVHEKKSSGVVFTTTPQPWIKFCRPRCEVHGLPLCSPIARQEHYVRHTLTFLISLKSHPFIADTETQTQKPSFNKSQTKISSPLVKHTSYSQNNESYLNVFLGRKKIQKNIRLQT